MIGVYVITNTVTGEQYVGASRDVAFRFRQHQSTLRGGRHCNRRLQAAWNEHGEAVFLFEGLEKLPAEQMPPKGKPYHRDESVEDLAIRAEYLSAVDVWLRTAEGRWQIRLQPAYNGAYRRIDRDDDIPMRLIS